MVGTGFHPGVTGNKFKTLNSRPNNSTSDGNILDWNPDGTYTTGTYFASNSLWVTDGVDEDQVETLLFKDLSGRTILKRQVYSTGNLDTYYIYNNAGMLIYVIPPNATALILSTSNYNLTALPLSSMVFTFTYDTSLNFGRLIQKRVPGSGVIYIIYDPLNRPVLVQDANMAQSTNNNWAYVKYDAKGRIVSQGIYHDATHTGQSAMQAYVNTFASSYNTVWYEYRSHTASTTGYYTNALFPTSGTTPLAYAYYDDYNMTESTSPDFSYQPQGLLNEETATTAAVKGMPTMVTKTTVGAGLSNVWLTTVTFYDERLHPIQTLSNNQLNYTNATTVPDIKTVVPDFIGVPQISLVKKVTGSNTVSVQSNFTYDQMDRVSSISQQYNGGTATVVAAYSYNEIGQLIQKNLGAVSGGYLQTEDLRYNIRSQLLSMNNSKLTYDGGITATASNDLFGIQYMYNLPDTYLADTAYYDGKLSAAKWMTTDASGNKSYERSYMFSYDKINRYRGETYQERATLNTTGPFNNNVDGFDETGIRYDAGGNILTLNRNSSTQGTNTHTAIDALTYTYSATYPDHLQKVADATGNPLGFDNYTGATGNYTFDNNGNMTADPYKGITIGYDFLNKTDQITVTAGTSQYINYTYDADGSLIRKQAYNNGTTVTTDYIDGFTYINSVLSYFPMPEGRVINTSGTLVQEFVFTDQQGNARLSFQNNGSGVAVVKQETSYYGYGLILANSPVTPPPPVPNKKLYNGGSEWQNDYTILPDYYQTFYRNYDAATARFIGVDPMAESAADMTTYNYAGDDPIMFNDPMGDILAAEAPAHPDPYLAWSVQFNEGQSAFLLGQLSGGGGAGSTAGTTPLSFLSDLMQQSAIVLAGGGSVGYNSTQFADLYSSYQTNGSSALAVPFGTGGYLNSLIANGASLSLSGTGLTIQTTTSVVDNNQVVLSTGETAPESATGYDYLTTDATFSLTGGANQGGQDYNIRQFIAIVAGESGNNMNEAAGIGSVMMNRMKYAETNFSDPNWLDKISAGTIHSAFNAYNGQIYNEIMNMTEAEFNAAAASGGYSARIWGAELALTGTDYSSGSYFWNATSQQNAPDIGPNWRGINNGTYTITTQIGGTTFFNYTNTNKIWP